MTRHQRCRRPQAALWLLPAWALALFWVPASGPDSGDVGVKKRDEIKQAQICARMGRLFYGDPGVFWAKSAWQPGILINKKSRQSRLLEFDTRLKISGLRLPPRP